VLAFVDSGVLLVLPPVTRLAVRTGEAGPARVGREHAGVHAGSTPAGGSPSHVDEGHGRPPPGRDRAGESPAPLRSGSAPTEARARNLPAAARRQPGRSAIPCARGRPARSQAAAIVVGRVDRLGRVRASSRAEVRGVRGGSAHLRLRGRVPPRRRREPPRPVSSGARQVRRTRRVAVRAVGRDPSLRPSPLDPTREESAPGPAGSTRAGRVRTLLRRGRPRPGRGPPLSAARTPSDEGWAEGRPVLRGPAARALSSDRPREHGRPARPGAPRDSLVHDRYPFVHVDGPPPVGRHPEAQ